MNVKNLFAKITSAFLITLSFYQTVFSVKSIFIDYPRLNFHSQNTFLIQQGLIQKAIILYITMTVSGIFGVVLLLKPAQKTQVAHIVFGILIFIISVFFTIQAPFSTDPISRELLLLIESFS